VLQYLRAAPAVRFQSINICLHHPAISFAVDERHIERLREEQRKINLLLDELFEIMKKSKRKKRDVEKQHLSAELHELVERSSKPTGIQTVFVAFYDPCCPRTKR